MEQVKQMKNQIKVYYNRLLKDMSQKRKFWGIVFSLLLIFIVGSSVMPESIQVQSGQPSPRDFEAPRNLTFESQVLTEEKKQEAIERVEPVYRTDETVLLGIQEEISQYFEVFFHVFEVEMEELEVRAHIEENLPFQFEDTVYEELIALDADQMERNMNELIQIVRQYMLPGVLPEDIELTERSILGAISLLTVDEASKELLRAMIMEVEFQGNRVYDPVSTSELQEKAAERVEPVIVMFTKNQKIVGKGEIITAEHIEILEKMGILTSANPLVPLLGVILIVIIFVSSLFLYFYQYRSKIYEDDMSILLIGLLIISTLLISEAVTAISIGGQAEFSMLAAYSAPVAAGAMLIAILFDGKLSMFVTTLMAVLVGIMNGFELQFALVAFVGGTAGIYSVSKLSQRTDLVKASLYIIGANIITIFALGLILNYSFPMFSLALLLGVINGILSSVLTIGFLPFWETAFGITTSVKLLELSNPNQPLLRKMLLEAPGTYHHSIVVGNMAEAAADAVGADTLLTRVGAHYHDIGKIKRPYFFIENQHGMDNPHDRLTPTLSTLIITSHIKDGVEMAKEQGLPQTIIDIIAQHHGNSLVSFFYHKAKESVLGEGCQADDFRYDSPKPKTKEAAIVMLADTVEAGVRAMKKPTPNKIEAFVRKVTKDKLEDGQLEECELTFKELDIIALAFVKVLSGIFHSRIEYPENILKEMEKEKIDGSIYKQSTG